MWYCAVLFCCVCVCVERRGLWGRGQHGVNVESFGGQGSPWGLQEVHHWCVTTAHHVSTPPLCAAVVTHHHQLAPCAVFLPSCHHYPTPPNTHRPNVICTPHLGASTTEAQEGVSTEVAEAVIDALQGKLAATAVNAPMVSAEVLKELAPFVTLAEALGKVRGGCTRGGGSRTG